MLLSPTLLLPTYRLIRTPPKTSYLRNFNFLKISPSIAAEMLPNDESLYLYNLTLRPSSLAPKSIVGQFSGQKKSQELVLATSTSIELYRPNSETGKVVKVISQASFANIQNIEKIRLVGTHKDLLVISSDSGKMVVAEFKESMSMFVPLVQEPHSKNGLSRLNLGEYLCVNPKNRALMVSAIERNKLVYKVEMENAAGLLELLSPIEVSSKNILTLLVCALDTGYENPLWAAIEVDYQHYQNKHYDPETSPLLLNYYELDQGLNHVIVKRSKRDIPASATLLVPLPGHIGGLFVCCKSHLTYEKDPGGERIYIPLPVREGTSETIIVNSFLHTLKKDDFFILLQSSIGDLFKITVDYDSEAKKVNRIYATYFDSISVCNSINVLKSGFLFANTTDNNKLFYQFEKLGEQNETTLASVASEGQLEPPKPFKPQGLQNLALVDITESLTPLVDGILFERSSNDSHDLLKQLVTLSSHSYMKILTHGLPATELVSLPLPLVPTNIFTTRITSSSPNDDYMVLTTSLDSKTLVLSTGEVVEEVNDSGFVADQHTLAVQRIGKHSIVQIHANGIRNIRHVIDEDGQIMSRNHTDWYPPAGITVLQASTNSEQIIIGLSNREVCYFEIDSLDDQLTEYQDKLEVSEGSITALCLASNFVGDDKGRSSFAIVASSDETIQVISLLHHNCFDVLSIQALSASCSSLMMMPMDQDTLYVHMGLSNGIYARVNIDMISGKLSDTRLRYLGTKPVLLRSISLPGLKQSALLLISSRPWLGFFNINNAFRLIPLLGADIKCGTSFYSEDIGTESVVGIRDGDLTIFTVGNDDAGGFNANNEFTTEAIKLRYSPRKQIKDSKSSTFFVVESEFGTVSPYSEQKDVDADYYDAFGYKRKPNSWASCLQVVDILLSEVSQSIEFEDNECTTSICQVNFGDSDYIVVGTSVNQTFLPPSSTGSFLYSFAIKRPKGGPVSVELVHRTSLDSVPNAIVSFNGKLLACIGNQLRLYELGKKQLLRKSSTEIDYLHRVTKVVHIGGDVILVGDAGESVSYLKFEARKNIFTPLCNDVMRRQITSFEPLDNRTVIGGDKFGSIFVSRVPPETAEQLTDNVLANNQENFLGTSGARLNTVCEFYVGDIVSSFQKGTFVINGTESVIYTGIEGTVGLLVPVATKNESEFLIKLETILRKHFDVSFEDFGSGKITPSIVGREHMKFRGYYNPVKNVIDGDYVEKFYELDSATKIKLAGKLDRTPKEVERKIYDLRNRAAF